MDMKKGRKDNLTDIVIRLLILPCNDGVVKPSQYVEGLVEELNRYVLSNDMDAYDEGYQAGSKALLGKGE